MKRIFPRLLIVISLLLAACRPEPTLDAFRQESDRRFSLQIFGDSRSGPSVYANLLSIATTEVPRDAVIHLGDFITTPNQPGQWPIVYELTTRYVPLEVFYPIAGNHDVEDQTSLNNFRNTFPRIPETGYYSARLGGAFCLFLNSEDLEAPNGGIGPKQVQWLLEQLASEEARSSSYQIVFVHRPLFPQNHHRDEPLQDAEALHQLFVANGVDMVFSGHEHSYSRIQVDGIPYIISGGAGSPLFSGAGGGAFYHFVQLDEDARGEVRLAAIDVLGQVRDAITFRF